ncbi:MAG: substrate-binding domain-containing protein [Desulfobacterales bacterium]|nr:substrate-binding domain-containing protein [Desulfobacterales bacterium]
MEKIKLKMQMMIMVLILALSLGNGFAATCKATYGDSDSVFRLATGSPGELGLLKELARVFNAENGSTMCWVKAGSGKSLKLLKAKEVDAIMVHAPAAEKQAVAEGWAIQRSLIGSNEFYIVGPKSDPAGIGEAKTAAQAYAAIARAQAKFLSRGDNSGTHKKEKAIWSKAGVNPEGSWYITTKDFMMATLKRANAVKGYFMTDSSTWVAGKKDLDNLTVLFRGDPFLINTYHGLCQPKGATPGQGLAQAFIEFLGSEKGQELIRDYGKTAHGEAMYNDAEYASQYDH